jgi:hypothetical protein
MNTNKAGLTILLALCTFCAAAQLKFSVQQHSFGQVPEAGGEVSYTFEFTNAGAAPIIITNVESSCGCTTPEWSKQPVLPKQKGFVKAIFDPKDRPGIFEKEITVTTKNETVKLKISGEVQPKTKGVTDLYPRSMGQLRLKSLNLPFAQVYKNEILTDSLPIINTGTTPLNIAFTNVPEHLHIVARPQTLQPNQKGSIVCTYSVNKKQGEGYLTDKLALTLNGASGKGYELTVSASIQN